MNVWGSVLDVSLLRGDKRFVILGCLVVEFVKGRGLKPRCVSHSDFCGMHKEVLLWTNS
jgi:hypothetical protein